MISEKMKRLAENNSVIRAMFEEGQQMSREFGAENVYDFSLGNPSVPAPAAVKEAIRDILQDEDSLMVHGYMSNVGYSDVRQAVAEHLNRQYGTDFHENNIIMTVGAAGGLNVILKTLLNPGDEVLTFAPYFTEYGNYVANYDGELVVVSPNTVDFQPNLREFAEKITAKTKAVIINNPNNPTGVVYSRETCMELSRILREKQHEYVTDIYLISDEPYRELAYEAFITQEDVPHTIYEIPGAKTCAIEFHSFSKTAGFTGNRCAYTVVPKELIRQGQSLNAMWNRRQTTKFNGVPYVVQRGAEAVYSPEGKQQVRNTIAFYQENARVIREGLKAAGLEVYGGVNSPYVWFKTPTDSWSFFDRLLTEANVVTTPGAGFGPSGEGYIRVTAFGGAEDTREAVERILRLLK